MNSKMVKNHNYLITLKILILFRVFKVLSLMIISSLLANYKDEVSKKREIGKSTQKKILWVILWKAFQILSTNDN